MRSRTRKQPAASLAGPARVLGYVRVSTTRQAEEGESLEVQRRQIEGQCGILGRTCTRVFVEEGVSGSKPLAERPQGAALLAELRPGDIVIASKLDRMFRSALDALQMVKEFQARGINLHLLDLGGDVAGNGISKLFLTIAAAFAEAERDRIRERIVGTKRDQKARGLYLGGKLPFGFTVVDQDASGRGGRLVEDPAQQAAIRRMVKLKAGGDSLRTIAAKMEKAGHKLSHVGVGRILDEHGKAKRKAAPQDSLEHEQA